MVDSGILSKDEMNQILKQGKPSEDIINRIFFSKKSVLPEKQQQPKQLEQQKESIPVSERAFTNIAGMKPETKEIPKPIPIVSSVVSPEGIETKIPEKPVPMQPKVSEPPEAKRTMPPVTFAGEDEMAKKSAESDSAKTQKERPGGEVPAARGNADNPTPNFRNDAESQQAQPGSQGLGSWGRCFI